MRFFAKVYKMAFYAYVKSQFMNKILFYFIDNHSYSFNRLILVLTKLYEEILNVI
jgi:hypothetical protein